MLYLQINIKFACDQPTIPKANGKESIMSFAGVDNLDNSHIVTLDAYMRSPHKVSPYPKHNDQIQHF